jgi:hypothetical protein
MELLTVRRASGRLIELTLGLAVLAAVVSGFSRTVDAAVGVILSVPNRSNATPSIVAQGDVVAVAWGASAQGGATDVYVATSRDGGRIFGAPVRVNDVAGDARLNGEQPPRVAMHGDAITVVWTTKGANGTKLLQSRSADGGRTFARSTMVPGGDAAGNRGWQNAIVDPRGRAYAVWLDHRELAQQDSQVAASHHDHAAMAAGSSTPGGTGSTTKPDGVAMAQRSKLYVASLDGTEGPQAITGGVCYCCKTALAAGADGTIYTAWRHVYPGNIRDIAFSMSRDGARSFAPPLRVSEDKWVLEGCPDDGPAMVVDGKKHVHIVWPTLITDSAGEPGIGLFYAMSVDGSRFTPRVRIPSEGMPHHPQIAIAADGSLAMVWDESANGQRHAAMARMTPDAVGGAHFSRAVISDRAVYPVVAAAASGTVLAWTSAVEGGSVIRVERR